jgi:UDP-glucose 4-epimerase
MRVLVTGGSGFIGSHVVDKLADAGIAPRIYDLRPSPHHERGCVDTVIGDLFDEEALRLAMADCDVVVHLAAYADVGMVADDPVDAEKTNSRGTMVVLEAARATGTRVVYGSTIWVYGASGDGLITEDELLGLPDHVYTATKLAGEMYCTSYAELFDVPCTILRFGIPYGPRARPAAVIPIFVSKALKGEPLTIAGDGRQTRRFVYVEDLAEGVVAALERGDENRTYNLAGDETVTIRELADVVSELVGEVEIVHTPGRNGDFEGAVISNERAAEELGWRASTSLREGVRRYLEWLEPDRSPAANPVPSDADEGSPEAPMPVPSIPRALATLRRETSAGALWSVSVVALACVVGTLIPSLLAIRTDDFGTGQSEQVAITCLIGILSAFCLVPLGPGRHPKRGRLAGWLVASYVALAALPWTRHPLELGKPNRGTVVLFFIGLALALALAAAAVRLRGEEDTAPEIAA